MERLGWWLCAGLAKLGAHDSDSEDDAATSGDADVDPVELLFGGLRESRIAYPLVVDGWQAVGEHLFEEPQDGVSVRYVHGSDRDRWIDVYFYPAGTLDSVQVTQAARSEAEQIRGAHVQAGYTGFDMGRVRSFCVAGSDGRTIDGNALDLAYTADGLRYSSAMTLLFDRLYFVKARYSIEESRSSRRDAREQLQDFAARLQSRVAIASIGDGWPGDLAGAAFAGGLEAWAGELPPDMRELRLEYPEPQAESLHAPAARAVELSAG